MQQLVTESFVVAVLGGTVGYIARIGTDGSGPALAPTDFPRLDEIKVTVWVLSGGGAGRGARRRHPGSYSGADRYTCRSGASDAVDGDREA